MADVYDIKTGKKRNANEKIAQELHTPEKFESFHKEWRLYHGKVVHPVSGKEVSKQELLTEELSDIVEEAQKDLKKNIPKESARDSEKVENEVWNLAKNAYLAKHGAEKEPTGKDEKQKFIQNVREYVVSVAREVAGVSVETYEQALAEIMAADNPVYGKGDHRSKILDALIQTYAQEKHVGKTEVTKGLSLSRLSHLRRELSTKFFAPYWHDKYKTALRDHGYDAEFDKSAGSPEIMGTVEELLNTDQANTKKAYIKAKTHERAKPKYDKAVGY